SIGVYTVRVSSGSREVFSAPAVVQLVTVQLGDANNAIAQDKFLDSTVGSGSGSGSITHLGKGKGGRPSAAAPAGGFTGTQIFNTTGSSKEPGEPNHC